MALIPKLDIEWPRPAGVQAVISCKTPESVCYGDGNLAVHVGDDAAKVASNRQALADALEVERWQWLNQVHGTDVACIDGIQSEPITADAVTTKKAKLVCPVLTADCLPVLFAAKDGSQVAAAHAGWRGLASGVLATTVKAFSGKALTAFLGPAIGPQSFEVGGEVKQAFATRMGAKAEDAFTASPYRPGHYFADLYTLAHMELNGLGVNEIYGGGCDTFTDTRFYSYRREAVTGRMVSAIWLE